MCSLPLIWQRGLSNFKGSFRRVDINRRGREGEKFIYHFCQPTTEKEEALAGENENENEEKGEDIGGR